jgi:hypothetical protein
MDPPMYPAVLHGPPEPAPAPPAAPARPGRRLAWLLGSVLAALLVVHVPAFLCLPPDADVTEWDLCTRTVLRGGVLYRDALENNLPGMLWLHLAFRSLVGWSTEALRAVDLAVVGLIVLLLVRRLPADASAAARLGTATVLAAFYLSTSTWTHCQRDVWMLLPSLLALELRQRQVQSLDLSAGVSWGWLCRPLLEGLLWGLAFWIKPFVAVPALACWLASAREIARSGRGRWLIADALLLVAGGLAAGAAGCAWLAATGAWANFWEVMWVWNREYVVRDVTNGNGWLMAAGFALRLFPWWLVHLPAVLLACRDLRLGGDARRVLLSALYIGWLVQAVALQHLFDYVHVPALLLAITVLCHHSAAEEPASSRVGFVAWLVLAVVIGVSGLSWQRLTLWDRCLREGGSPELRDRLTLVPSVIWTDLDRVRAFLQECQVRDGELTCYSMRTLPVYMDLGVRPSTRYFLLHNILANAPRQRGRVYADLVASRQRYFLCDLTTTKWKPGREPSDGRFQFDQIVFRAGRYLVFALDAPSTPGWIDENLDP